MRYINKVGLHCVNFGFLLSSFVPSLNGNLYAREPATLDKKKIIHFVVILMVASTSCCWVRVLDLWYMQ